MADDRQETGTADVVLMVCIECGNKYRFEGGESPLSDLTCDKCGNEVFRRFDDATTPGEAEAEFEEETDRDLDTSDPEGDAAPGDLLDLNRP